MNRGRLLTRAMLLLIGVGLALSACVAEPVGYEPVGYGYDGFAYGWGHGFAHGHEEFGEHGRFEHGGFEHGGFEHGGEHGGFAGHGFGGGHGGGGHR